MNSKLLIFENQRRRVALLVRYGEIFRIMWQKRHDRIGERRRADEVAFLPAALSLQETPPHPVPGRLAFFLTTLFSVSLVWSIFGQVDMVAVASGRIEVSERTKVIQPLEAGVVQRVHVRDGDHVDVGQILVELDSADARANTVTAGVKLKAYQSELLRARSLLEALFRSEQVPHGLQPDSPEISEKYIPLHWSKEDIDNAQLQISAQWDDIRSQLLKLDAEMARRQMEVETARAVLTKLEKIVPLVRQRESDFTGLADQGFVSRHAQQDKARERMEIESEVNAQRRRLALAEAARREGESYRNAYIAEKKSSLREKEVNADLQTKTSAQELVKAFQREKRLTLLSPVRGTVQQLTAHTNGGVVTEAQPLMVIVPDDSPVTAEVSMQNKDVGFVRVNQEAIMKLETFPYTRYGTVPGRVLHVTRDAVHDEKQGAIFPVTLQLQKETIDVDGTVVRISPGMNVTAEVKTGRRRIIEYLLDPVRRGFSESMRER